MAKPPKQGDPATEIVQRGDAQATPVDMDDLRTTIRTRVAGRLLVADGPGKGQSLPFFEGSSSIGRDPARNVVALDFGDTTVHREPHAYLTADRGSFTLAPAAGRQNPITINGTKLTGPAKVGPGDVIVLGKTTLKVEPA